MGLIPGLPYDLGLECLIRVPHQYLSTVASVCRSWKREIQLPEFWRRRKASGLTRKVVVMAQSRVDPTREIATMKYATIPVYGLTICEPETGFWAELPPVPGFPDGLPMYCQLVGVGLNLVVMGGWDPVTCEVTNGVFIYSPISTTWRRGADMPGCRRLFFACASDSDGTVFVAGGHDTDKWALKSAMAYHVARDEWTPLPDMNKERDEAKGVYLDGKFHVIGGYPTNMQGRFDATAECFDAAAWRWGPVEDFLDGGGACPRNCVESGEGEVVMCCGSSVMERRGSTWRVAAEVASDVRNIAFVTAWQGKVMVIGSERFGAGYKSLMLDLKSGKWEGVGGGEDYSGHVQSGCCLEL